MSDDSNEEVGSVKVSVTSRAVHKAVRNILANECKVDPEEVRVAAKAKMHEIIKEEVIAAIARKGYGANELDDWVRRAVEARVKEVDAVVKQVVRELVSEKIREEIEGVVAAIVRTGMEVSIGWKHKVKVQVRAEEKGATDG